MKRLLLGLLLSGFTASPSGLAQHPPLSEFGYESMRNYHGELAKSPGVASQRCLVILLDDDKVAGGFAPGRSAYFQNLIFNTSAVRDNNDLFNFPGSVNGFLAENSKGAFTLVPAIGALHPNGMLGPLTTTDAESDVISVTMTNGNEWKQIEIALNVAIRNGWVLKDFDFNNDGIVTASELLIIVIKTNNNPPRGRTETRTHSGYTPPGQHPGRVVSFQGYFVGALNGVDFASLVHEVAHTYGADDIYSFGRTYAGGGPNLVEVNFRLTLMGFTYSSDMFHLDCWHKMGLGWAAPRIFSLRSGGIVQIPAAQRGDVTNPVLLYDPAKGTGEYFMLEYRTSAIDAASTYDGQVLQSGVWLWHIQMNPNFRTSGDQRAINVLSPLSLTPNNFLNGVWTEGPPYANGDIGVNQPWTGGMTSYFLKWNDGTATRCRFHVRPFVPTDAFVTVEILPEDDAQAPPPNGPGGALSLDGTNDYVRIPDSPALRFDNQFTIEFWFKPSTLAQGSNYLVSRSSPNTSSQTAVVFGYSSNQVEFYALGHSGDHPLPGSALTLPNTNWHHIAYSYDGATWSGYLDGAQIFSVPRVFHLSTAPNDWTIGVPFATPSADYVVAGSFDEVRLWNLRRSTAQIQEAMRRQLFGNEAGLVGYWRFDEGTGLTAADATLQGQTASLVSGPMWITSNLLPFAPEVEGDLDAVLSPTSARLFGSGSANNSPTMMFFQWGPDRNYGNTTPLVNFGSGTDPGFWHATLTGLTSGATYHARAVATNSHGTSYGLDFSFTTPESPVLSIRIGVPVGGFNTVILSWPNPSTGYVLQQTANMSGPGGGWADVTETPVVNGANKEVTLQATGQFCMFRLRRP